MDLLELTRLIEANLPSAEWSHSVDVSLTVYGTRTFGKRRVVIHWVVACWIVAADEQFRCSGDTPAAAWAAFESQILPRITDVSDTPELDAADVTEEMLAAV